MNIGIDIGSTSSKVAVLLDGKLSTFVQPTGWSSVETAANIKQKLLSIGYIPDKDKVVATGYGRISVDYANKVVTEITCHGKGASYLFEENCCLIDIGGQDTKIIRVVNGFIEDFIMNDKCSAGTGKFIEIMANKLGVSIPELGFLAKKGSGLKISSMCTVFAESEIISFIGRGESKENIANAILESVLQKVAVMANKFNTGNIFYLSGGLCEEQYILERLSSIIGNKVISNANARFAGAIGAAIISQGI